MQSPSSFPGCYSSRDLNGNPNGGPWLPMYTNDISPNIGGQSYNNFFPQPNVNQIRVVYGNEVLRQTMLRHENIFREQVQELHRLHRRQRELMDEFKRRGLNEPSIMPTSHYNFILSRISSDCSSMTWQMPTAPALPWLNPAANKLSTPGSKSPISTFSFLDASPRDENGGENDELLRPKCRKPKRKTLDLELPADEYGDSEEENGNGVQTNSSRCSNDKNVNMMAFDLNMPPTLSTGSEIFQTNMEIVENGAKPDHDDNPNNDREEFVIFEASLPPICVVGSELTITFANEELFEMKSEICPIDLNSCVGEDEHSPTLPISKTIIVPGVDLKAPVSPENKESLPPRGESKENLPETLLQRSKQDDSGSNNDLVSTAAETILSLNEKTVASLIQSLDWFAGVVVSSAANNLEAYEAGMSSDRSGREEKKCIVALPSQQGKRHRKRRTSKKISDSLSSPTSYNSGSAEKGLKSWGKVNKRRRGPRVPASSIRLLRS